MIRSPSRTGTIRGVALFEVTLALLALVILALVMLKASLNVTEAQRWTVVQSLSDAFLTHEVALAARIPYGDLLDGANTPWPTFPASKETEVELGRLPGGVAVTADLHRTKMPAESNLVSKGGTASSTSNAANMETWIVKSLLSYDIGGRSYVKTRTTVRVR